MLYIRILILTLLLINFVPVSAFTIEDAHDEAKLTSVRVQLKWFHQFQFAGFYAAIEKGFFKKAGLDVELIEGGPTIDPTQVVIQGHAEFGIGNSTLLIDFNNGYPVLAVSAIFQHSPFVILARRDADIRTVKDLEGHRLMGETHAAELLTYLKLAGVDLDKIDFVPHTGTITSLKKGHSAEIDATTAYISHEPYFATKENVPYQIFNPRDLKIDFYADTLFTSQGFAAKHPEIVKSMRDALAQGWQYARANQDEIITLILKNYHTQTIIDRLSLVHEAQVISNLIEAEIIDIGYMSLSRWKNIGDSFLEAGELTSDYSIDGFLYEVEEQLPLWVYLALLATSLLIATGTGISIYIFALNRRLSDSLDLLEQRSNDLEVANRNLSELSNTDPLTGIANRRHFDKVLATEFLRARRKSEPLTLLMLDVDYFKKYNDQYGHQAGDDCLIEITRIINSNLQRAGDLVSRYGGEEFVVIVPNMNQEKGLELANRICSSVAEQPMPNSKSNHSIVTVSIGVFSCIPENEMKAEEMINKADLALYRAKTAGRNMVKGPSD